MRHLWRVDSVNMVSNWTKYQWHLMAYEIFWYWWEKTLHILQQWHFPLCLLIPSEPGRVGCRIFKQPRPIFLVHFSICTCHHCAGAIQNLLCIVPNLSDVLEGNPYCKSGSHITSTLTSDSVVVAGILPPILGYFLVCFEELVSLTKIWESSSLAQRNEFT